VIGDIIGVISIGIALYASLWLPVLF